MAIELIKNLQKIKNLRILKGGKLERIVQQNCTGCQLIYVEVAKRIEHCAISCIGRKKIAEDVAYRIVYHTRDFF